MEKPTNLNGVRWTALIDDIIAGRWVDAATGRAVSVPFETIVVAETLEGAEADLVAPLKLGNRLAVVSDERTHAAMGQRIEKALAAIATIDSVVLREPHAGETDVETLRALTRNADGLVAVGSGTINDLAKYVTVTDGREYCVFGTAPSMNGYTSTTASITLASGMKVSKKAHAPKGVFLDLKVNAEAPTYLIAAGLGDSLCRSTAQVDWLLSHRLFGTFYTATPFLIQEKDEAELLARAAGLAAGDIEAVGYLQRVLTLCGLGVSFAGGSHPGSMGEHQISHFIDSVAGDRHPRTLHGQQVGVASLTMARLQAKLLASETPPLLKPTVVDDAALRSRFGEAMFPIVASEFKAKALDAAGADALNARLAGMWPELRRELQAAALSPDLMREKLASAGGPTTASELGCDVNLYRQAVLHAREIRNRYSMLDLAADAGLLEDFVEGET